MSERALISLLVPVYNEEANVGPLYEEVVRVMAGLEERYDWELVFTDNDSSDDTLPLIVALAERDARVRVYHFSRNFGFQRSILAGYKIARGRAVIQLDCDLQDPPELIASFLEHWERGYQIVYGVRAERKEGHAITAMRWLFYRIIDALSEHPLPHDAGDFRLVDRAAVDELLRVRDARPYIRGTLAGLGYEQIGIPYARAARERGRSKFSLSDLFSLALDGILSQSTVPLKFATYTGAIVFALTVLLGLGYLIGTFFFRQQWPRGFATLVILILGSLGLNALFLGIIGEYVSRIFRTLRQENRAIVSYYCDATRDDAPPTIPLSLRREAPAASSRSDDESAAQ